jgi:hypothetical protein
MKRFPVSSTCIAAVGYDAKTRVLEIEYSSGEVYQYFEVPPRVYRELVAAESHGAYINREIKHAYRYRAVGNSGSRGRMRR